MTYISYQTLHSINKRAVPQQIMKYKLSLNLSKICNDETALYYWLSLFFNQSFRTRTEYVNFFDQSNFKAGKNLLSNRFIILNGSLKYEWLNLLLNSFKIKYKTKLLWLKKCHNAFIVIKIHDIYLWRINYEVNNSLNIRQRLQDTEPRGSIKLKH